MRFRCPELEEGRLEWRPFGDLLKRPWVAIDLVAVARAEGFRVSGQPAPDQMVVFGSAYGAFGHIATLRAVQGDRYEVIEQNFVDFNPNLEPHWQTFDLRSVAWPDPAVVGFIDAPPSG